MAKPQLRFAFYAI